MRYQVNDSLVTSWLVTLDVGLDIYGLVSVVKVSLLLQRTSSSLSHGTCTRPDIYNTQGSEQGLSNNSNCQTAKESEKSSI